MAMIFSRGCRGDENDVNGHDRGSDGGFKAGGDDGAVLDFVK